MKRPLTKIKSRVRKVHTGAYTPLRLRKKYYAIYIKTEDSMRREGVSTQPMIIR